MSITIDLGEHRTSYELLRDEAFRILRLISERLTNRTDALAVQSVLENKDFYWKHSFALIEQLSHQTGVEIGHLRGLLADFKRRDDLVRSLETAFRKWGFQTYQYGLGSVNGCIGGNWMASVSAAGNKAHVSVYLLMGDDEEYTAEQSAEREEKRSSLQKFIA